MIEVRCTTNLDGYNKVTWPSVMCCRPMIGDQVRTVSGEKRSLKIVGITHSMKLAGVQYQNNIPILVIELHN